MTVVQILLIKPGPLIGPDEGKKICSDALALKDKCLRSDTQKPYIISLHGGRENSPEEQQARGDLTHGFMIEFESKEDRDYFMLKDPAHLEFVKENTPKLADIRVFGFEQGVF